MNVQPPVNEKTEWVKPQWIDEPQLEVVKPNPDEEEPPRHGGERPHP